MVQEAVAVVVRRDDGLVLAARRPDEPDEELPGVWGLPATTLAAGEPHESGLRRIGREKLDVMLAPGRALGSGEQERRDYTLRMTVYEATIDGEPAIPRLACDASSTRYDALDWRLVESFRDAADRGSLCCRLFLDQLPAASN